jgi:hypothetical protein
LTEAEFQGYCAELDHLVDHLRGRNLSVVRPFTNETLIEILLTAGTAGLVLAVGSSVASFVASIIERRRIPYVEITVTKTTHDGSEVLVTIKGQIEEEVLRAFETVVAKLAGHDSRGHPIARATGELSKKDRMSTNEDPQPSSSLQEENEDVAAMLRSLDRPVLSECVVAGKYLRYDPKIRNILKDKVRQIEAPLRAKSKARENFLIWAAPGSGKTYLIQQIYEQLKLEIALDYIECNLAKDEKDVFVSKVNSLSNLSKPVLCLLDEIDARANEEWSYEVCFPKLDLNTSSDKQVVIVLIGSTQSSVESMMDVMGRRHKGRYRASSWRVIRGTVARLR